MFTHLKKNTPTFQNSTFLTIPAPLKTANPCGELELILAKLAEASPRGDDDTDLYELFLAAAVLKLL